MFLHERQGLRNCCSRKPSKVKCRMSARILLVQKSLKVFVNIKWSKYLALFRASRNNLFLQQIFNVFFSLTLVISSFPQYYENVNINFRIFSTIEKTSNLKRKRNLLEAQLEKRSVLTITWKMATIYFYIIRYHKRRSMRQKYAWISAKFNLLELLVSILHSVRTRSFNSS